MKLEKFEQSGFICELQNGFRIAWDIARMTPIERLGSVPPVDVMIISHIHGDHFSLDHIKKLNPKRIYLNRECVDALGEEEITSEVIVITDGTKIDDPNFSAAFFHVEHGPNISAPIENVGFILTVEGETIYFAGDMFFESGIDVSVVSVDYALIPVGTFYTFGPQEAYNFAKKFKHIGTVIPIHYHKTPETSTTFATLAGTELSVRILAAT